MPVVPPAPPQRQASAYSLHERTPSSDDFDAPLPAHHDNDDNDDDDDNSVTSERSDQSEEAAGLVSRLSDEQDRATRRAMYEGASRLGAKTTHASNSYRTSDDFDEERGRSELENEGDARRSSPLPSSLSRPRELSASGISTEVSDGLFRDRSGADKTKRRAAHRRGFLARTWAISREALPTLSLSLVSLVLSGELLIHLAKWPVFSKVDKLFILIPILLNLKGNLEGNLSLRMSTSANIGELDVRRTRRTLIFGNLALLQVQALIVSLFAGTLSFILGIGTGETKPLPPAKEVPGSTIKTSALAAPTQMLIRRLFGQAGPTPGHLAKRRVIHHHPAAPTDPSLKMRNTYFEFVMVIASAMLSASVSSAILGSFMCALVVVTRQLGGNPDNIASPLAGSLGDLLTLTLLGLLSSFLVRFEGTILATLILLGLAAACAVCFVAAYRNAYVRELLSSGWIPLVIAMFISSGAGVLLDSFVQRFEGFALVVPVMTGLPGACAAIFVSRTSTALHGGMGSGGGRKPTQGRRRIGRSTLAPSLGGGVMAWCAHTYQRYTPAWLQSIGGPTEGWLVPGVLFGLGMLVNIGFISFVYLSGQMTFGAPFWIMFTVASAMGFTMSLVLAHTLSMLLWRYDYDPDIYCLPFVTSLIDVIGQSLLVMSYFIATSYGDKITAAVNDGRR